MEFHGLSPSLRDKVRDVIAEKFGPGYRIADDGEFYGKSGMRYGYVAVDGQNLIVVDATPDMGDVIIATIKQWRFQ